MKCLRCKHALDKQPKAFLFDLLTKNRNPFYCFDCNELASWKTPKYPPAVRAYESSYLVCTVTPYNYKVSDFLDYIIKEKDLLCEVVFTDDSSQYVFPIGLKNDYIHAYGDTWSAEQTDKMHEPDDALIRIPLYRVKLLKQIKVYQDYYESDPPCPMYGFKAMIVKDGKISDEYQLGVLKEVDKLPNPYWIDYQDCYLHYCERMEEPLLFWNRDYIKGALLDPSFPAMHLFKVKAEGHYRKNTDHGWVANKLTLTEEVSKEDIISYFEERPELLEQLRALWEKNDEPQDLWEQYKSLER